MFLVFIAFITKGFNPSYTSNEKKLELSMGANIFENAEEPSSGFTFKSIPFAIKTYFNKSKSQLQYEVVSSSYAKRQQEMIVTIKVVNNADFQQIPIMNLQFFDNDFNLIKDYDTASSDALLEKGKPATITVVVNDVLIPPSKVYVFFRNNEK